MCRKLRRVVGIFDSDHDNDDDREPLNMKVNETTALVAKDVILVPYRCDISF